MSNREPSLLRRIYPALALTGVGFGMVNVLDRPAPVSSLADGALMSTDASTTTVVGGTDPGVTTTVPPTPNSVASQGQGATEATPATTAAPKPTAAPAATAAPVTTPAPAPAPAATECGAIVKTGSAIDISWRRSYGSIKVTVKFNGSRELCSASASYQTYDSRSARYEDYAVPILNQQAESAKSANIQGVSGATAVSLAYQKSLQSAIDQL